MVLVHKKYMRRSFTLTEIVVGALIIASIFGGLLAAFIAARRYVKRANKRLVAVNLSRKVFDELYPTVRADQWQDPNNPIYADPCVGGACPTRPHTLGEVNVSNTPIIDGLTYGASTHTQGGTASEYIVERVYDAARNEERDYRRVTISIEYPED